MVNAGHLSARGAPNRVPMRHFLRAFVSSSFFNSAISRGGEVLCDLCCPPIDRSTVSFFSSLPENGGEKVAAAAAAGGGNPDHSFRETNRFNPLYIRVIMPAPIFLCPFDG